MLPCCLKTNLGHVVCDVNNKRHMLCSFIFSSCASLVFCLSEIRNGQNTTKQRVRDQPYSTLAAMACAAK
jgi:hypothetical protein